MSELEHLSVASVAERLDVSTDTVYRLVRTGKLAAVDVSTGTGRTRRVRLRIPVTSLRAYLDGAGITL